METVDLSTILKNVYEFFIEEQYNRGRIGVHRLFSRLMEATGLISSQLHYRLWTIPTRKAKEEQQKANKSLEEKVCILRSLILITVRNRGGKTFTYVRIVSVQDRLRILMT